MITKKEITAKKTAIEEYISVAKKKLEKAQTSGDKEGVATATFLVAEYEEMLKEFLDYYGL